MSPDATRWFDDTTDSSSGVVVDTWRVEWPTIRLPTPDPFGMVEDTNDLVVAGW
jgi:hypothetical protein